MNIRYWLQGAPIKHPQKVMRELGIKYLEGIPQSVADQWWFIDCDIPNGFKLPEYMEEMEFTKEQREYWLSR